MEFGLTSLPYQLYTLKHNPDKTDPKYFEQMFNDLNLKAEEVVYFEHNSEAVKSAESLGITSYHYDAASKDIESLRRFLNANLL